MSEANSIPKICIKKENCSLSPSSTPSPKYDIEDDLYISLSGPCELTREVTREVQQVVEREVLEVMEEEVRLEVSEMTREEQQEEQAEAEEAEVELIEQAEAEEADAQQAEADQEEAEQMEQREVQQEAEQAAAQEQHAAAEQAEEDLRLNTRSAISRAKIGRPMKRRPRGRPNGAPLVNKRFRVRCTLPTCSGDVAYYDIARHLRHCHREISDVRGEAMRMKSEQKTRVAKRPLYRCPECAREVQVLRRHLVAHFDRDSEEFRRADAEREKV